MSSNWNSQTSMTVGGYQVFQSQPVSMDGMSDSVICLK